MKDLLRKRKSVCVNAHIFRMAYDFVHSKWEEISIDILYIPCVRLVLNAVSATKAI